MLSHPLSRVLITLLFQSVYISFGSGFLGLWFMASYISSKSRGSRTDGKRVCKTKVTDLMTAMKQREAEGSRGRALGHGISSQEHTLLIGLHWGCGTGWIQEQRN